MEIGLWERLNYSALAMAAILVTAFTIVQPMQVTYSVEPETVEAQNLEIKEDSCKLKTIHEDPTAMNTVRKGSIAKTIHVDKTVFSCLLEQGDLPLTLEIMVYVEIFANITEQDVVSMGFLAIACLKDPALIQVLQCTSATIPESASVFLTNCSEATGFPTHPQEMNTVNKREYVLTIEAQKEIFFCDPSSKVDVVMFALIFEDLEGLTITQEEYYRGVTFVNVRQVIVEDELKGVLDPSNILKIHTYRGR